LNSDDPAVLSYNIGTGVFTFVKPDTDQIFEGENNLYWTLARTRENIGINVTGNSNFASYNDTTGIFTINATTDNLSQGVNNLFFTNTLARAALTLSTNNVQNSLLTYNNQTGQFSVNPSTANLTEGGGNLFYSDTRVRNAISVSVTQLSSVAAVNSLTFNNATGVFTFNANTNNITEGNSNLYFTQSRARTSLSLTSNDTGVLSYDNSTGVFVFNKPTTNGIAEGNINLYFTAQRARDSINVRTTQINGQSVGSTIQYEPELGRITINANTDNIAEGATNKYASIGTVSGIISLTTTTTDGATPGAFLSYNNSNGTFTFNNSTDSLREGTVNKWASSATVRAFFSNNVQTALTYDNATGVISFTPTVSPSLVYLPNPTVGQFHFNTAQDLTTTGTPRFRYISQSARTGIAIVAGEVTIDLSQGMLHEISRNQIITTIQFTNVPPTAMVTEVTLVFVLTTGNPGFSNTNSFVKFAGATAPTLTSTIGRRDIIKFVTYDGLNWYETSRSLNIG
jgi:hypothetical protein